MKSAPKYKLTPAKIALLYAAFSGLWIFATSKVLSYLVENPETMQRIEVAKGLAFVSITTGLLYLLLRIWREPKLTVHQLQNQHIAQPKQYGLFVLLVCLSLVVPLSGLAIAQLYAPKLEHQAFDDLISIAKLKSSQVELWVKERTGDANFLKHNKTVHVDVNRILNQRNNSASKHLQEKFQAMIDAYGYSNVVLLNLENDPRVFVKDPVSLDSPLLIKKINEAITSKVVVNTDFYFTSKGELRFDLVVPITDFQSQNNVIGLIVLVSSPKHDILPLINQWPTSETTAKTLLLDSKTAGLITFDQDKPKALFPDIYHPFRTVYEDPMFRTAKSGQFKGLSHDGVRVLIASYPLAGLDWKVITQIDEDEVHKPLHGLTVWVSTVAFFSIAALSAAILMIWRQRNRDYNLAVMAEKTKSDALINHVFDMPFIGMAMVKAGSNHWFNVNDEFCRMIGYSRQELLKKTWAEVSHPDDANASDDAMRNLIEGNAERQRIEKRYVHKNGQIVYVQLELKAIKDGDGKIEYLLGAVSDITHFKLLLKQIEERERRLDTLVHTIPDLVWLKDPNGVFLSCNRQFERLYNSTEKEIVGKTDYEFVPKELADFFRENDLAATKAGYPTVNEEWLTFADNGETNLFETIKTPIHDQSGQLIGVLGIARNITERHYANEKIQRLTQLYAWQGQCNRAIIECQSEAELFEKICHSAVNFGGLSLAWIGIVNHENQMVEVKSSYGEGLEYLDNIKVSVDADSVYGRGPTGTCIRNNHPYWCKDFMNDPITLPWRTRAAQHGWRSSASIPLSRNESVMGALTLYSNLPDAFDDEIQELLLAIAQDINFALSHLEAQTAKRRAEAQLLKLSQAVEQSPNTIVITDLDANIEYVNDAFCRITGYNMAEVIGRNPKVLQSGKTPASTYDDMWDKLTHGEVWQGELVNRRKDNSEYIEYAIISPIKQSDGTVSHYLAIKQDITEIKRNEAQLKLSAKVFEQGNEGIIITDHDKNIIMVNRAFAEISGYSAEEVIGKNPKILSSGHQDGAFYRDMWDTIETTGRWQGELWNRRKDGGMYPELLSITRVIDENTGKPQYIGIFTDITQSKMAEDRIRWLAHYDALTGLANRELLHLRASQALSSCTRHSMPLALMFLDLDRFKNINDSLGHQVGDELIKDVGSKLKACLRDEDTIARLGGDEFVVVLANADAKAATQVAEKILNVTSQPIKIADYELNITASIGIAIFPDDSTDLTELMQKADTAMYRTKQNGRNGFSFFTPDMQATADRTLSLDNALRRAIEKNELMVFFQPQINLANGKLVGAEALLRWKHPQWGMISPAEFIPIAEDSGQILQIGEWVLRNALLALKTWLSDGFDPFRMSVNLSAIQFRFKDLPDQIQKILEESGVPPEYLELEITESVSMQDPQAAIEMTKRLSELGIRLSIDDFGTGYSSLSYLKQMNVYKLKIDQSFVRDISIDQEDKAIVNAVIGLAKSMGMITIAEGVETEEQCEYLKQNGCNEVQGYYFGRPMDSVSFENFLKESHPKV